MNVSLEQKNEENSKQKVYDILVIDDNITIIQLLTYYFEYKELTCKCVKSGPEAIKDLQNCTPKLILLYIDMPEMDGYEICKKIKDNEKFKKVPVYFITAVPRVEVNHKMEETKADGCVFKPFNIPKLDDLINCLKLVSRE